MCDHPCEKTVWYLINRFDVTGSIPKQTTPVTEKYKYFKKNIVTILEECTLEYVDINFEVNRKFYLSSTIWWFLHQYVKLNPFKTIWNHELHSNDHRWHCEFSDWTMEPFEIDVLSDETLCSNKTNYRVSGIFNKQNFRIWSRHFIPWRLLC